MISTGDKGLDAVITGLRWGDNVVWQIDAVDNYLDVVKPFVKHSLSEGRRIVYIRFAHHAPLMESKAQVTVHLLDPAPGFETFSAEIHKIIAAEGEGVIYVFDCLSDLLSAWSNDLMVGNFFKVTCPYLFELNTIAYFSLLRNSHSFRTVARIRDTTQLLIDMYHHEGHRYVHPLKVWNRYSPTMFLPHIRRGKRFVPITRSVDSARLFSHLFKKESKSAKRKLDYWDKLFLAAEDLSQQKRAPQEKIASMVAQLSRLIISREEKMLKLAQAYFSLDDFVTIKSRMVGTGYIGGKSVGMLIARKILTKEGILNAEKNLEPHDSFYVGSDVFYTYIVENAWWKDRMEQRTEQGYFEVARSLRQKMLKGHFPEEIKEQFKQMIEYFGQSPIIVRSSSLLEDSYGNAFAGKYESVFLVNRGSPEERYTKFVDAVRLIYTSAMSEDALVYRRQRGLSHLDEQMALLVQRVSGGNHGDYFFPDVAGVGMSHNAFVWKKNLDPRAGMVRLVFGLGTRAVNRVEGDYPRIVALDEPLLKAQAGIKDAARFSQHAVDVLNLKENSLQTVSLRDLSREQVGEVLALIAIKDHEGSAALQKMGIHREAWIITFDPLLSRQRFPRLLQKCLRVLENAYGYPVDIEFTVNFKKADQFQINLLQCRPMQTKGMGSRVSMPKAVPKADIIFQSHGNFFGGNLGCGIDTIIYVDPQAYCRLETQSARYDIARLIGALNRRLGDADRAAVMLLGPGRWGTTTPSLGVPVSFAEINHISVLGEIAFSDGNVMPELSFGTHFFQDLVEAGIFYVALFPGRPGVYMNREFFAAQPKRLAAYVPTGGPYENVVNVIDVAAEGVKVAADIVTQKIICYR